MNQRYPLPKNEANRLKALKSYGILDTLGEERYDKLTELASTICGAPVAFISFIDEHRQWLKSTFGIETHAVNRKDTFCQYTILGNKLLEVEDASVDNRFKENIYVKNEPNIRFYAGMPLTDAQGYALGAFCVVDYKPKKLNKDQKNALKLLADHTIQLIEDHREKSEAQYINKLLEISNDLVCLLDHNGSLIHINSAFSKVLGIEEKELLTQKFLDLVQREGIEAAKEAISRTSTSTYGETTCKMNGNGDVEIHWVFVQEKGTKNIFAIGRDVTEFKNQKKLLELTHSVSRIAGLEIDYAKNSYQWTSGIFDLLELEKQENLTLEKCISYFEKKDKERLDKAYMVSLKKGKSFDLELAMKTDKEHKRWVRVMGVPEMYEGKCIRFIGAFQDITERKILKDKLIQSRLEAEFANKAKTDFLANMSHEIRTPLNGVLGFTELVSKTDLNPTQKQYLEIARQSGTTLLNIINDILDFSKIEAGKIELNIEKTDLFKLASEAVNILSHQAESKEIELMLSMSPELPRFVRTDSVRLKQILVNLLSNAVKFTEKGEVELAITTTGKSRNGELEWHFLVRDTGVGIQLSRQKEIFKVFSQEDPSTTKKYGGTGLGLSISNSLLKLMNSKLSLESEIGKGSKFYFELSLKSEHGVPQDRDFKWIHNLLLVDDNKNNRHVVKEILKTENIDHHTAEDGFKAFEQVRKLPAYDVIVMDYHMPYMDGLESIRKIRAFYKEQQLKIPYFVLFHSVVEDMDFLATCRMHKVDQTIIKPISADKFLDVLNKLPNQEDADTERISETLSNRKISILIVEDNPVNMILTNSIVKNLFPNAEIEQALNGKEAFEKCSQKMPDIILMDVLMPVMNGYEATRQIRSLPDSASVPIIAVTAGSVRGEKEKCFNAGMNDFIMKPISEYLVKSVLKKWIYKSGKSDNENSTGEEIEEVVIETFQELNADKFMAFTSDDPNLAAELFSIAKSEIQTSCKKLMEYARSGDENNIKAEAHKLKGTTGSLGLEIMSAKVERILEQYNMEHEVILSLVEEIEAELQPLLVLMEKEVKKLRS